MTTEQSNTDHLCVKQLLYIFSRYSVPAAYFHTDEVHTVKDNLYIWGLYNRD